MKHKPHKKVAALVGTLLAAAGVLAIPQAFIYNTVIMDTLQGILGWQVSPRLTGGTELARFLDPVGDDSGAGSLVYPKSDPFAEHRVLDLVRYRVHQPQTNAAWAQSRQFWQLELGFADLVPTGGDGFAGPMIRIYIDTDGAAGGSTDTLQPRSELLVFDPAHPWDLCVSVDAPLGKAELTVPGQPWTDPVPLMVNPHNKSIILRIPLQRPEAARVLDGRATWHYVVVGAWDPYSRGHYMLIKENPGLSSGGGSTGSLTPRIYDCLLPPGIKQAAVLGAFDDNTQSPACLAALEVPPWNPWLPEAASQQAAGSSAALGSPQDKAHTERLAALARQAAADAKAEAAQAAEQARVLSGAGSGSSAASDSTDPRARTLAQGVALFRADRIAEADAVLTTIAPEGWIPPPARTAGTDDSQALGSRIVALAWRGAIRARQGGAQGVSVGDAVRLVNEGYVLMDQAVASAANTPALPEVLAIRGNVSRVVPEAVFRKSQQGSEDFATIATLLVPQGTSPGTPLQDGTREWAAECWVHAGLCLEQTGDEAGAILMFQRAQALSPTRAATLLELAKRDLWVEP